MVSMHTVSLSSDALADVRGDVDAMLAGLGLDPDEPHPVARVCVAAIGTRPQARRLVGREGHYFTLRGVRSVVVHALVSPERQRWLVGHELGHWWYETRNANPEDLEARCDAFGACLVAPAVAFRSAVRSHGHRVHALARAFATTQAIALLRLGEVTGRPVAYLRAKSAIARGEDYAWPPMPQLADAVKRPPNGVHPVRVDGRWGLMAA